MNELSSHGAPQNDRKVPELEAKAAALAVERDAVAIEDGDAVAEYVNLADTLSVLRAERRDVLNLPAHCVPFLQPGRLVRVCARDPKRVASAATRAGEDGGAASLAAAGVQTEWGGRREARARRRRVRRRRPLRRRGRGSLCCVGVATRRRDGKRRRSEETVEDRGYPVDDNPDARAESRATARVADRPPVERQGVPPEGHATERRAREGAKERRRDVQAGRV